ncbi:hypothetical protein DFQ26_003273 [Actinomortierella ambigua]|nr:hypothetical protein DFQ26_003273 [Actinomortierella ambigua]
MATINIDVITLVIENVGNRGTLFSLLTVNKQIFRHTCAVLYSDPFRFFRHKSPYDDSLLESKISLLWLLMNLSPAVDDDANRVRKALAAARKQGSETEAWSATKLDYLSFIQCVRFRQSLDVLVTSRSLAATGILECYSTFKSTLTWSICGHRLDQLLELEIEARDIERFVQVAPQLCRLRIIVSESKTFFQWDVAIRTLLPPLLPHGLKLVLPLRPMDSYLSRLAELRTENSRTSWWGEIFKNYTDMAVGQVLQRCRRLLALGLRFGRGGIKDASVLAWAVDERRDRAAGRLLVPAVPLAMLGLSLAEIGAADAFRVLVDGIRAFGPSLYTLWVVLNPLKEEVVDEGLWRFPLPQDEWMMMPRLRTFKFISPVDELLDVRLLQCFPNLTTLNVTLGKRGSHQGWPVIHLPHLTDLELYGLAVCMFNPASLHVMPQLQVIILVSHDIQEDASDDRPTLQDNWTWDWDLPKLKAMSARMDLSQAKFSFRFFRGCPNLSTLYLDFLEGPVYPLDVSSTLTNPTQDTYPNLHNLDLRGRTYTLELEDLRILLGYAFPGLDRLFLSTYVENGEYAFGDVSTITADELHKQGTAQDAKVYDTPHDKEGEYWIPIAAIYLGGNSRSRSVIGGKYLGWKGTHDLDGKEFEQYIRDEFKRAVPKRKKYEG